jgi:phosphatidylglycerophosphate synthase
MSYPLAALETLPLDLIAILLIAFGFLFLFWSLPPSTAAKDDLRGPISPSGLDALAVHKYKASDYTILDNFLNPWWTWLARFVPLSIAPNIVTLCGWLFYYPADIIFLWYSTSTVGLYDPFDIYKQPSLPPYARLTFALSALAIFWYQTFDALDGKHARSLGVSGIQPTTPLGQLFDHGCDAVSTILITILSCFALRVDLPGYFTVAFMLLTSFYIGNWAEKYTHVLMTNVNEFFGVTEGQYLAMTISLLPAIFGPDFWLNPISTYIGYHDWLEYPSHFISIFFQFLSTKVLFFIPMFPQFLQKTCVGYDLNNLPLGYVLIWFLFLSGLYMIALCLRDVAIHIGIDTRKEFEVDTISYETTVRRRRQSIKANQPAILTESELQKIIFNRTFRAYCDVIPFFFTLFSCVVWYAYSLPNPDINKNWYGGFFYHPVISIISCSLVTVHLICQVIVNAMSYSPNVLNQPIIIPMIVLQLIDIIPSFMEHPAPLLPSELHFVLWALTAIGIMVTQVRYALVVIKQISNLFGIFILKLGFKTVPAPVEIIRKRLEGKMD